MSGENPIATEPLASLFFHVPEELQAEAVFAGAGSLSTFLEKPGILEVEANFAGAGSLSSPDARHYLALDVAFDGAGSLVAGTIAQSLIYGTFQGVGTQFIDTTNFVFGEFTWSGDAAMEFVATTEFIQFMKSGEGLLSFSAEIHLRSL